MADPGNKLFVARSSIARTRTITAFASASGGAVGVGAIEAPHITVGRIRCICGITPAANNA